MRLSASGKLINFNDLIGSRTRDFLVCSIADETSNLTFVLHVRLIITFDEATASQLLSPRSQTETIMEIPFQEGLFTVRSEAHPRCEPRGLKVYHPEDGGNVFLRNVGF
jgi:hypothetical protein